jgi:hypothetical protein
MKVSQQDVDLNGEICSQPCGLLNLISDLSDKDLACAALSFLTLFLAPDSFFSLLSLDTQTRTQRSATVLFLLPLNPGSLIFTPRTRVVLVHLKWPSIRHLH